MNSISDEVGMTDEHCTDLRTEFDSPRAHVVSCKLDGAYCCIGVVPTKADDGFAWGVVIDWREIDRGTAESQVEGFKQAVRSAEHIAGALKALLAEAKKDRDAG